MKKLFKKFAAIGMAAMMIMAMGVTVFAAENNATSYTSAQVYYEGEPAPYGMDTGCFESVGSDDEGNTVITLKSFSYMGISGYIESCVVPDGTDDMVSEDNSTLTIPASAGDSIEVEITFGGTLGTLIDMGLIPMDNPMLCEIVLS